MPFPSFHEKSYIVVKTTLWGNKSSKLTVPISCFKQFVRKKDRKIKEDSLTRHTALEPIRLPQGMLRSALRVVSCVQFSSTTCAGLQFFINDLLMLGFEARWHQSTVLIHQVPCYCSQERLKYKALGLHREAFLSFPAKVRVPVLVVTVGLSSGATTLFLLGYILVVV